MNVMFLLKLCKADSYCLFSKWDSIIPTDNVPLLYQMIPKLRSQNESLTFFNEGKRRRKVLPFNVQKFLLSLWQILVNYKKLTDH